MMNSSRLYKTLLVLSFIGFLDASYLAILHFQNAIPPCAIGSCERVLTSEYAVIAGVPVALVGTLYYITAFFLIISKKAKLFLALVSAGFAASLVFLWLQLFVIRAICQYCIISIGVTTLLFAGSLGLLLSHEKSV